MSIINKVQVICDVCGEEWEGYPDETVDDVLINVEAADWEVNEDFALCSDCKPCEKCNHAMEDHYQYSGDTSPIKPCIEICVACEDEESLKISCAGCGHVVSIVHKEVTFCGGCPECKEQIQDGFN